MLMLFAVNHKNRFAKVLAHSKKQALQVFFEHLGEDVADEATVKALPSATAPQVVHFSWLPILPTPDKIERITI